MDLCNTVEQVAAHRRRWRAGGERFAFVPTMGSLHAGHLELVREARRRAARVVVSIYVNPLQFGPTEDYAAYPRHLEADAGLLAEEGVDLLFAPSDDQIYPYGRDGAMRVVVPPALGNILCGAARPGHFDGVATVVARLLNIVRADVAVFGEKDYQQLLVIKRLVSDLRLPVQVVGAPTARAADGLALSSRNAYLTPAERARAPALHQTLEAAAAELATGVRDYATLEREGAAALRAAGMEPDYFSVRRLEDLAPPAPDEQRFAVLAAARLGRARLIDNVLVGRTPD
ncbi:pantoate--beta-alanine ligase [Ectothiorhodospiraceae bacterium 2226]|nr:pantoate--beta-alanine ligase [Ectothiorhodospiraceae bacterium 2226]